MADANTIIRNLGQQVAQLTIDKAILEVEVAEKNARIEELEGNGDPVAFEAEELPAGDLPG